MKANAWASALAVSLLLAPGLSRAQSLSYSKGQPVFPAYEGWEEHPDGSRSFLFGYQNENWEEEVNVPIGPDNSFSLGGADQGQPTHFLPRRNRAVFRVPVPANFTEKDELVWTLTTHGETIKAYATLMIDYKVDDLLLMSESGALGAGSSSPEVRANKAPMVKIQGPKTVNAKAGQPVTLNAVVTDDGVPKPRVPGRAGAAVGGEGSSSDSTATRPDAENARRVNRAMLPPARITVGKAVGLHVSWIVYRGAGRVTFDPEQIAVWEDSRVGANSPWAPVWTPPVMPPDGRVTVRATFDEPGTYILWSVADDGGLTSNDSVTVMVAR